MKTKLYSFFAILITSVLLSSSCSSATTLATNTPIPPTSTITVTPLPAPTSTPTITPSPTPVLPVAVGTSVPLLSNDIISPANATHVVQLAQWGKGVVHDIVWSPDMKTIAFATSIGVYLYEAQTLTEISFIKTDESVFQVDFFGDGQKIAFLSKSGNWGVSYPIDEANVSIWDITTNKKVSSKKCSICMQFAISPDDSKILLGGRYSPQIWDIASNTTQAVDDPRISKPTGGVAYSPDGNTIAIAGETAVYFLNSTTGKMKIYGIKANHPLYKLSFSYDGKILAGHDYQGSQQLLDLINGGLVENYASGFAFSPDSQMMALADVSVIVLIQTGKPQPPLTIEQEGRVLGLRFSPDGKIIAASSAEGSVSFWDTSNGEILNKIQDFSPANLYEFVLSPDGNMIASRDVNGNIVVFFDMMTGQIVKRIQSNLSAHLIGFFPDSKRLAFSTGFGEMDIWDIDSGQIIQSIMNGWYPDGFASTPDGQFLGLTQWWDGALKVWNIETVQEVFTLNGGPQGFITFAVMSSDGKWVAAEWQNPGYTQTTIHFWNVLSGEQISKKIEGSGLCSGAKALTTAGFSPDNTTFVYSPYSSGKESRVKVWDLTNETEKATLKVSSTSDCANIAFSPNGALLATATQAEGEIKLWDTTTWREVSTLADIPTIDFVSFSADGKYLITAGMDGIIRVWGINSITP